MSEKSVQLSKLKVVLSIAGSDCSGGAGIQADVKTMCAHGVYGMTAITALTAQNTLGVSDVYPVTAEQLEKQLDSCLSDIPADAIKIGMLPNKELLATVIQKLQEYKVKNIVLDPVMVSTSGKALMDTGMVKQMEKELFPMCTLITPNIPEAEVLSGEKVKRESDMERIAKKLGETYGCAVLVKGGHFREGEKSKEFEMKTPKDLRLDSKDLNHQSIRRVTDVLYYRGEIHRYEDRKVENPNTHGTGCTLSSAIASNLALDYPLEEAVKRGKSYVAKVIAQGLDLGHGIGPMNHMVAVD